ncbi:MAG: DUF2452 domain-containing protein [Chromatiales bacterium]|jgi:hypothetical protein
MAESPNPQGKGQVSVLAALSEARRGICAPPKNLDQISAELFTSLFMLESDFQFKPVPGKPYWLYRKEGRFRLSPIAPEEWRDDTPGLYIGRGELQRDLTWTLQLSDQAALDPALTELIENRKRHFDREIQAAKSVDRVLPVYAAGLPFYQRVLAAGLAYSLGSSMRGAGIHGLPYDEAKGLLGAPAPARPRERRP